MASIAVNTFDDLRNLDPTDNESAYVLGYASKFDGFGGIFIRRNQTTPATADNDSTVLVSNVNSDYIWRLWR